METTLEILTNRFAKTYMIGFLENLVDFLRFLGTWGVDAIIYYDDCGNIRLYAVDTGEDLAVFLREDEE
jgi:hypothetical protein